MAAEGGRGEGVGGFDKLRRAWRRRLGLWPHGDKSQWWRSGGGGGGVWGCTTVVQKEGGIATERGREGQSTAFSFWERIGGEGGGGGRSDSHENRVPQLMEAIKAPPTPKPMPRRRRRRYEGIPPTESPPSPLFAQKTTLSDCKLSSQIFGN